MGQEECRRECLWDDVLRKTVKACGKKIAEKQIARPLSFQIFVAANPSRLPLSFGFQAEIQGVVPKQCFQGGSGWNSTGVGAVGRH